LHIGVVVDLVGRRDAVLQLHPACGVAVTLHEDERMGSTIALEREALQLHVTVGGFSGDVLFLRHCEPDHAKGALRVERHERGATDDTEAHGQWMMGGCVTKKSTRTAGGMETKPQIRAQRVCVYKLCDRVWCRNSDHETKRLSLMPTISFDGEEVLDADKLFGGEHGKEAIVRAWRCPKTFLAQGSLAERYEGTSFGGLPLAAWELIPELSDDTLMTFARAPGWKGLRPGPGRGGRVSRRPGEESTGDVKFEFYCCGLCYCCLRQDGMVAVMRPARFQTAEIIEYALPAVKTCGFGPGPDPDWSNVSGQRTSQLLSSKYVYEEASSRTISGPGKHAAPGNTRTAHHPNRYRVTWEFVGGETAQVGCHHRNSPDLKAFHELTVALMQQQGQAQGGGEAQGAPASSAMKRA
jgi:hypothetical protein